MFGDDAPQVEEQPLPIVRNVSAPGFRANITGDQGNLAVNLQRNPAVDNLLADFRARTQGAASDLRGLRPLVAPGVSALRTSQLNQIENARNRAIGDLRENLSRRRVAGSSFANDALARAESEFAQASADVEAKSTLQELALTSELIGQELKTTLSGIDRFINQINTESELAVGLSDQARSSLIAGAQIAADVAKTNAELEMKAQQAAGQGIAGLASTALLVGGTLASGGTLGAAALAGGTQLGKTLGGAGGK